MSKRKLQLNVPPTKRQKIEDIDRTYALQVSNSKIKLLICGYLRENKLFKCFHSIIYKYYPLLYFLNNCTYNPLSMN